jgi:tRNA A-37 threonylcarbamoyl transferase component Bud32
MIILNESEYKELLKETETIEKDQSGEKVLKYTDGKYMKLFRRKRLFSSALIYPYWRRFVRNAHSLKKKGIPTIDKIESVVRVPHIKKTGVVYLPLKGDTLKFLIVNKNAPSNLPEQFGEFVSELHHKGIYFSSLHLGNVVMTASGEMGLIDISDMRSVPFQIPLFTRKTNLDYLFRCRQGMKLFTDSEQNEFIDAYLKNTPHAFKKQLTEFLDRQLKKTKK